MPEAESNEWTVEWYRTAAGEIPAKAFLARLAGQRTRRSRCWSWRSGVETGCGNRSPRHWEVGSSSCAGIRSASFYVFRPDRTILILDGMVKKQDKIPNDVIKRLRGMQQALATADAKAKAKRGP